VPRSWSLTAEVAADEAEALAALLFEAGASGLEERDDSVAPMPGARRPAPGRSLLLAWFAKRAEAQRAARALPVAAEIAEVADQDWSEGWKRGLGALSVGRVFLRPSWVTAASPPGSVEVVLDPDMAFGTGTHPTTALCLAALGDFLRRRPGASIFDVGTGSGLLAIAARKLGAGRVVASDDDPVALRVARENARRNGLALELTSAAAGDVPGPFDLVVANILASTLVELAPQLAAQVAPGGTLLLSGILVSQQGAVRRAYLAQGLLAAAGRREGEWSLLRLRRPA
jgi:ribosomal protein L11 methyltransferase